jgi:hypothetical protein
MTMELTVLKFYSHIAKSAIEKKRNPTVALWIKSGMLPAITSAASIISSASVIVPAGLRFRFVHY